MNRRGLQAVLTAIGSVATVAGAQGVVQGGAGILRGGKVSANADSEFRFHASWYAALGVLVLLAARRPEAETRIVRVCGAGFLVAACSRVLSWATVGKPHPWFRFLMAVEFAIPAVIVPWQSEVARASHN
jgi:uncharacterized protein DUF4345